MNALGWTVVALVTWTPSIVNELGFQLSVCAVLFVLSWGPRWGRHLGAVSHQAPGAPPPRSPWVQLAARAGRRRPLAGAAINCSVRGALQMVAISVSATLGTMPLILFYFQRLHPLAPLWNLCVYPFAAATLICGLVSVLVGLVHPAAALPFVLVEELLVSGLVQVLDAARAVPGTIVHAPSPPGWTVAAVYGLLAAATLMRPRWFVAAGVALLLACLLAATQRESSVRVDVLQERWGRAALIHGAGKTLLVDAGDRRVIRRTPSDLPAQILSLGENRIHAAFMTGPDLAVSGGIDHLAKVVTVDRVFVPPAFATDWIGGHLLRALDAAAVPAATLHRGTCLQLGSQLKIDVLYPPAEETEAESDTTGFVLRVWIPRGAQATTTLLFVAPLNAHSGARFLLVNDDLSAETLLISPKTLREPMTRLWLRRVQPKTIVFWGRRGRVAPALKAQVSRRGVTLVDGRRGWRWHDPR